MNALRWGGSGPSGERCPHPKGHRSFVAAHACAREHGLPTVGLVRPDGTRGTTSPTMAPERLDHDPFRLDPPRLPRARADYAGPCLLELVQSERSGRGRWYAEGGGYTDILTNARAFSASEAREYARRAPEKYYPVNAWRALKMARKALDALEARAVSCA